MKIIDIFTLVRFTRQTRRNAGGISWPFSFIFQSAVFLNLRPQRVLLDVFETDAMKECARCLLIWVLFHRSWLTQGSSCWKDTKRTLSVLFSNTQGDNRNTASSKTCLLAKAASDLAYITFLAGCSIFRVGWGIFEFWLKNHWLLSVTKSRTVKVSGLKQLCILMPLQALCISHGL